MKIQPPLPPFTIKTAAQKVRMAEDAWNSRDPDRVVLVYTEDTVWRNRVDFPVGRAQVRELLTQRFATINDLPIKATERQFFWTLGRRPEDHPGLSELGL